MLLASFGLKAFRKKLNLPHAAESRLEASFWYGGGPLMSGGVRRQSHEGADRIRHDIVHHHAGQTTLEKEKR